VVAVSARVNAAVRQFQFFGAVFQRIEGAVSMNSKKLISFVVLILAVCSANLTVKAQEPEIVEVVFSR